MCQISACEIGSNRYEYGMLMQGVEEFSCKVKAISIKAHLLF